MNSIQLISEVSIRTEEFPSGIKRGVRATLRVFPVSDRCSRGECDDLSGPMVPTVLSGIFQDSKSHLKVVPDEIDAIQAAVREW